MFSPLKTLFMTHVKKWPFMLNHKINIACDCHCRFCDIWKIREDPEQLLSQGEIEDLLDQGGRVGVLSYSIWGGEPLLREDLPALMAHARRLGLFTTISTNGSLLKQRASELVPHTSLFLVSLDGIGETHDRVRGFPGLFEKTVAGIEAVKKAGARVRLFYNVNKLTMGDVAEAARLARELRVSVFYFPVVKLEGFNERLVLSREEEREVFDEILRLKSEGLPVLNLRSYLRVIRDDRRVACRFPWYHLYVDWDGRVYSCDLGPGRWLAAWGHARDLDLAALFESPEFKQKARELENCNACRLSCAEIGYSSPLAQFPFRLYYRLRHEWLFQAR